jgi:ABC transport system ATP-binding/permease protein
MNLLSVSNLSKSFGERVLFTKISFGLNKGDKVALVAENGSGKTTLFKILKGTELADEGEVVFRREIRTAFLEQDFSLNEGQNASQLLRQADNPFVEAIRNYEFALAEAENTPGISSAAKLETTMQKMNDLDAWNYEKNMKEILSRLEIRDLESPVRNFSGGQKKRLALALCLINNPDLLVMDEPTNHLDIEMIEWLESYLSNSSLTLLLVTHDRYFLDNVCDRILELDQSSLYEYRGDFENYVAKKAERISGEEAERDRARNLYRRELEWIRKMPKARGTKAKARVNAFGDLTQKTRQKRQDTRIQLDVKMERLGSKIMELHEVSKGYGEKQLIKSFTYTFVTGEKVGLVGKNGSGKSTLLKLILGTEEPDSGKVQRGDTVVFGYYSQAGIQLADDKRVIEVVKDIAEHIPLSGGASLSASQLLTRFNFPPARQYSRVSKLSGGEKRRLYLLTVLARNPNFLVLDEPSNDLDLLTLQTLEEFLEEFKGCVLIASHDRFLLDRIAEHTFALEGDGEVKDYPGGYTDYRSWKDAEKNEKTTTQRKEPQPSKTQNAAVESSQGDASKSRKLSYKVQRELEELEKVIPLLETKKQNLAKALSAGINDYDEIQKLSKELSDLETELDQKSMRWLEIQETL